ncbi:peptidoglycan-binding domain-containing protein [Streptomyces sp. NPDC003522]
MNDPTNGQGRPGEPAQPRRHGHPCPRCGALRAADNTPSCACARQASDALRDTREAEAAAAEDFDPLRIRPYVELGQGSGAGSGSDAGPGAGKTAADDMTMPLPTASVPDGAAVSDATMPLRVVPPSAAAPVPAPLTPSGSVPSDTDLSLFEAGGGSGDGPYDDEGTAHGRRRRTLLIASTAAVVAVIAAAGLASGMFSYEAPARDRAASEEVRAAVPDTSTSAPPASPSASRSASPSASSASPSPSESASASPSAAESSASPSPSRTTEPSPSASDTRATPSLAPGNGADGDGGGEVTALRRGDRGPEVTELQLRLRQVYLYNDEANGMFNGRVEDALRNYQWSRGVQGDELGTYGAATRARLESETKEP